MAAITNTNRWIDFICDSGLNHDTKTVLYALSANMDQGTCWLTFGQIAAYAQMKSREVKKAIRRAQGNGYLVVKDNSAPLSLLTLEPNNIRGSSGY